MRTRTKSRKPHAQKPRPITHSYSLATLTPHQQKQLEGFADSLNKAGIKREDVTDEELTALFDEFLASATPPGPFADTTAREKAEALVAEIAAHNAAIDSRSRK